MEKATKFLLRNKRIRENLIATINALPLNEELPLEVKISESSRTLPQNDMFHALCGDVSKQMTLNNEPLNLWQWKNVFVSGHWMVTTGAKESPLIRGIEGELLNIRESTSQMRKKRMSSLIEYSTAWAIQSGVKLRTARYEYNYYGHRE